MKPAARELDWHTCPRADPKAHMGGRLYYPGAGTVFIQSRRAFRAGDAAHCGGSDDIVEEGSATVLIAGMVAARKGDKCWHGGKVTQGSATVLIGGPAVTPPSVKQIIAAQEEIDRRRRRIGEREERIRDIDAYIDDVVERHLTDKGIAAGHSKRERKKIIENLIKLWLARGSKDRDKPAGFSDFTEEELRALREAVDEKGKLKTKNEQDRARVEQLQRENDARRRGENVPPSTPAPGIDEPLPHPITGFPPIT